MLKNLAVVIVLIGTIVCSTAALGTVNTLGPLSSNVISYTVTDWTDTLILPLFDPTLGTLLQMDLTVNGGIRSQITVSNHGSRASNGNVYTETELSVWDPLGLLELDQTIGSPTFTFTNLLPGNTTVSPWLSNVGSVTGSYTDTAILNEFIGDGTLTANTSTATIARYSGGNDTIGQVTEATAYATVVYYYQPVPEPSAIWMVLTGLGGCVGLRRFRRK